LYFTAKDFNLPEELHVYHSLYPLDQRQEKSMKTFGYPSWVYKSVCSVDGRVYCLRRIEGKYDYFFIQPA